MPYAAVAAGFDGAALPPFARRGRLGFDGALLGAVARIFVESILGWYRRRLRGRQVE
jgi:hypothetical protein